MTATRYVVMVSIGGKEYVRRALWSERFPTNLDVFTNDEFAELERTLKSSPAEVVITITAPDGEQWSMELDK